MNVISPPTQRLLALSFLTGVGPATLKKIVSIPQFESLDIMVLASQISTVSKALGAPAAWEIALEKAEQQISEAKSTDARILSACDSEYPHLLAATKDDPFILFVRGRLSPTPQNSVAVIGTREPTPHGERIAARITEFFVEHRWSVVSGLAIGCDAIAHQATLDAGGHTVAVLAHGLQTIAPPRHKKLAENILAAGGALISEYPFGREIQRQQYVKRDRTQAGMARGVVMIQSDVVGGSLHASRAALDYNRWLAVPFPTEKDLECDAPKIQANLVIANGSDRDRAELLRCSAESLRRILVLRSKEDYRLMIKSSDFEGSGETSAEYASHSAPLHHQDLFYREDEDVGERVLGSVGNSSPSKIATVTASSSENGMQPHIAISESADAELKKNTEPECCLCHVPILRSPFDEELSNVSWRRLSREIDGISDALDARLVHLQRHLNSANRLYCEIKFKNVETGIQDFLLTAEDLLTHLERTADFLLAIELQFESKRGNQYPKDDGGEAEPISSFVNAGARNGKAADESFMANLSSLLRASTYRLMTGCWERLEDVYEHPGVLKNISIINAESTLVDAKKIVTRSVNDFNELVRRVLYSQ
ncbi:DNA-protecting protein DprA [Burkholderia cenocepacia]|uniref:DNA-processing protein DprA n=1 Tax=Burkholderia cenocepacia TaxID=95486 RepID=UPI00196AEB31|nr:DNA-processing protein DprA [Burkholderia cenocepacia]MBN3534232.1 DNA-protecting protein DprA [Burkholderia cenocepacia]